MGQAYGATGMVDWYKEKGIDIPFHNGTDFNLSGGPDKTYGSELAALEDGMEIVKRTYDIPMSTKGNGVTIQTKPFEEDGILKICQFVYWHCSEIENKKNVFNKGETVAWIGNSGAVSPEPSPACIYCGSHLHLMLFEYFFLNGSWILQEADNGVGGAQDPMKRIDMGQIFFAEDTGIEKDLPPIEWVLEKIREKVAALALAIGEHLSKKGRDK